jgi:hypothetical protein
VSKKIDAAAVREAVDQQGAIVTLHDHGLAASVTDAFHRVGERLTDKLIRISQHRPDRHDA